MHVIQTVVEVLLPSSGPLVLRWRGKDPSAEFVNTNFFTAQSAVRQRAHHTLLSDKETFSLIKRQS